MQTAHLIPMIRRGLVWLMLCFAGLALAQDATPTPSLPFPIRPFVPVEGNINDATPVTRFAFEASTGADVRITMAQTSGDLDPFLLLLDPEGLPIAQNDDAAEGVRDSEITLILETTGTYIIEASRLGGADGFTSGTYRLLLEIEGQSPTQEAIDPLTLAPPFAVNFTELDEQPFGAGDLSDETPRAYFAIPGRPGDLLRAIVTVTSGDLQATLNILTPDLTNIAEVVRPREGEIIAFTTAPQRDWYLVEVQQTSGAGAFSIFVDTLAGQAIAYNQEITDEFTVNAPTNAYTFQGTIGDQLFISTIVREGAAAPQILLQDIGQGTIAQDSGDSRASVQVALPRSGTYILRVTNTAPNTTGAYRLRLNGTEQTAEKLAEGATLTTYNTATDGNITANSPVDLYVFQGKRSEQVTVEMNATDGSPLDPFLVLMDENLNEIAVNDNARGSRNARIAQFALPADGRYFLLASRAGLDNGTTSGAYRLALSVGAVTLEEGPFTATVRWNGDDDLNLFIREPSGRILSWSNPETPESGILQIDSNTDCAAISPQPVEHIYWPPGRFPADGDYTLWVWYQNACGSADPVSFNLTVQRSGDPSPILVISDQTLEVGQRFAASFRVSDPNVFVLESGQVTRPSPQQRASEGGDEVILLGESKTNSLDDSVYARFYQFFGTEDETITLTAERVTGNLDPILVLRTDTEQPLAQNDDIGPQDRSAAITYTLPYTGRYVVAVTRFGVRDGTTRGSYRLSLVNSE